MHTCIHAYNTLNIQVIFKEEKNNIPSSPKKERTERKKGTTVQCADKTTQAINLRACKVFHCRPVGGNIVKSQFVLFFCGESSKHHVEYVEVSFVIRLNYHSEFFQQIFFEGCAKQFALGGEDQLQVLAKSGAVVVHYCLGIPKCF